MSRQAIHEIIKRGLLTKGDDGLLDFAQAQAELAANMKKIDSATLNAAAAIHEADPPPLFKDAEPDDETESSFFMARKRREEAEAGLRELKLQQTLGTLIDRASYERAAMQTARILRDTLINNLPGKISPRLAALADPWEIEQYLREVLRGELKSLCEHLPHD